jgi:hypothetical protein
MGDNEGKEEWETVGVVVRVPDADAFLRQLSTMRGVYVVFSKKSRLRIKLIEEGFR